MISDSKSTHLVHEPRELVGPNRGANANVDFWQAIYSQSWKIYDGLAGKVAFGCYWRYS